MSSVYAKVEAEALLFIHPESKIYYLRKRSGKTDTHISLKTTKIPPAEMMDYERVIAI